LPHRRSEVEVGLQYVDGRLPMTIAKHMILRYHQHRRCLAVVLPHGGCWPTAKPRRSNTMWMPSNPFPSHPSLMTRRHMKEQ
jgi:hypothetical protein